MSSILIVDDEIDYCIELKKSLSKLGHHIAIANSAEIAIQQADDIKFDVLLVDMMLKEKLDGISLAEIICQKQPKIKTILMSGFLSLEIKNDNVAQGYIEKPFKIKRLISTLEKVLNFNC